MLYSKVNNTFWIYGGTAIKANDDLNDYIDVGNYYCQQDSTSKTLLNCPIKVAFTMKVIRSTGLYYPAQLIINHMNGSFCYRMYDTTNGINEWRGWNKIESVAI